MATTPAAIQPTSLIRYDPVQLVSKSAVVSASTTSPIQNRDKVHGKPALGTHDLAGNKSGGGVRPVSPGANTATTAPTAKLPPVDDKASKSKPPSAQTDDILGKILPPREWEESGQLWIQRVSSTPATRLDVINLQEQLDQMLQKQQARETGICPVRRELYTQCFDELIRQVTISCQERGLLLLRVRDEIRMSIAAYQTLYESSVAFGMRKALMSEWGKAETEDKLVKLEEEKKGFEVQIAELKAKCDVIEKREMERRAMDERKHNEELGFMKKTNLQLKTQLEGILAPQKK